ncbi:MAG: amidohydrolase family protein [Burkholderiales bacterium]|nr:amidohydrolase family protein [Burkholderiales bacterium]
MSIFSAPKIDCHCHILDPVQFAYAPDVAYRPQGQETGSAAYFAQVLRSYGFAHALLVGPNSGYGTDNRCMLDAIVRSDGMFKGIAVVPNNASADLLQALKAQGVVGIAFNVALHGLAHYADIAPLLQRLADLQLFAQVQVDAPQMVQLAPLLLASGARILIDHGGRPTVPLGPHEPGFQSILQLGATGLAHIKLSGWQKFSALPCPFADTDWVFTELLNAFGPTHCMWGSDWPFLRATQRLDYGPLLNLFAQRVPNAQVRQAILWDTPRRLFGFGADAAAQL